MAIRSYITRVACLEARNLTKCYTRMPAVDAVSFTVAPGEIVGYLGPNGSGKSTTVRMLTGLLRPTTGHIFFEGLEITSQPIAFRKRLGYVPEEPNLYPYMSGREYLQLVGRLRSIPERLLDRKSTNCSNFSLSGFSAILPLPLIRKA